ncbi:hypothetical protein OAH18_01110 [bacterium]|nr:hypothetical protein [bacterium]
MPHFPKPFFRKSRKLWYVQLNGKQQNLGPDRDRAFELYYQLMQQKPVTQQVSPVSGEMVVALIDAYLDWCVKHRAAATYEWYRWRLQLFTETIPSNLTVSQLKPFHVQGWIDSQDGWGSGSKRNGVKAIQRAMRWAVQQGYIERSPIAQMQKPAMGKREVVLSPEEFQMLLDNTQCQPLIDLLNVTWETGCRPQESLRVEARHVDVAGSRWVIPVSESKTDIVRVIYLTESALETTTRLMRGNPTGPLFRNTKGVAWNKDSVSNAIQRIQVRVGKRMMLEQGLTVPNAEVEEKMLTLSPTITSKGKTREKSVAELRCEAKRKLTIKMACSLARGYCLYHIRHTWMNRLLRSGVDAMTVAILAGHSDPSMLAKTYQHLSQSPEFLLKQVRKKLSQ